MSIIIFLIVLAVLIFVHELGHFLLARANGIRVDAFKIGFGPKILSRKIGETEYGLNLIPFGGYVSIHGENPNEESRSGPDSERSFTKKNKLRQISVLFAGVGFNFIFAWLIYTGVFCFGVTADGIGFEKYSQYLNNNRIMVTQVVADSPAERAGLKVGDILKNVAVENTPNDSQSILEIQNIIASSTGNPVTFDYQRGDSIKSLSIVPEKSIVADKFAVGIAMSDVVDIKLPFHFAIYEAGNYTLLTIRETAVGLYNFILNIFMGSANFEDVSGPIGIINIVGSASELGIIYLLMMTALISINLGVINLVPFPALDGGRILFVIIEAITRRRIPDNVSNMINTGGFILLMLLMILVTYKDIVKIFR